MFSIQNRGVIYNAATQPPSQRIAFFTSLCCLSSGSILCGFQVGSKKHAVDSHIGLCRSDDQGASWYQLPVRLEQHLDGIPGSLGAAELVEAAPGRLLMFATWFNRSEPERPLFDPVTEGILKSKQLLAISEDDGLCWSSWRELPTADLKGCALTGPAIRWGDGRIAFAFESFREYDDPVPEHHAAWIMISQDQGVTFGPPLLVAQDPAHRVYYWDQRLCGGAAPGMFHALFWTHDLAAQQDLSVHCASGVVDGLSLKVSEIQSTTIRGQIAAPARLDDGRLVAFVVDRSGPCTMTLWCSEDNGSSWPESLRLVVYTHEERAAVTQGQQNIDFRQYWEDMGKWSFGHPAIRQLNDGSLLLAWYAGTPDCMSIHCAKVVLSGDRSI